MLRRRSQRGTDCMASSKVLPSDLLRRNFVIPWHTCARSSPKVANTESQRSSLLMAGRCLSLSTHQCVLHVSTVVSLLTQSTAIDRKLDAPPSVHTSNTASTPMTSRPPTHTNSTNMRTKSCERKRDKAKKFMATKGPRIAGAAAAIGMLIFNIVSSCG